MADEYISKQDAIDAIHCDIKITGRENAETVCKTIESFTDGIKSIEPADVAPEVHGEWEDKEVIHKRCIGEWQSARCSACGKYHTTPYMYYFDDFKFCPNCGAKMDAQGEE